MSASTQAARSQQLTDPTRTPRTTRTPFVNRLEREFFHLKDQLAANRDQPAVTADGVELSFLANINNVADVQAAKAMGAAGIGLFRTEYLYLTHPMSPAFVPSLKDLASHVTTAQARELLQHALHMKTITRIKHFMRDQLIKIAPNLSLLDSE